MAPTSIIIAHGGEWADDKSYNGGRREIIPIPPDGMKFRILLSKIELRLMKPMTVYAFEIDALDEGMRIKITDDYELDYVMRSSVERPVLYITVTRINAELSCLLSRQNLMPQTPVPNLMIPRHSNLGNNHFNDSRGDPKLSQTPVANSMIPRHSNLGNNHFNDSRGDPKLSQTPAANSTIPRHSNLGNNYFNDDDDPNFDIDEPDVGGEYESEEDVDEKDDGDEDGGHEDQGSFQHNVSPLESQQDSVEVNRDVRQWTIPGASFHSSVPMEDLGSAIVEVEADVDCTFDKVSKGAIFSNKFSMISSLGLYHLVNHFEFSTQRSCKKRYHVVCKHNRDKCPFVLRASAMGIAWKVDELVTHTCQKDLRFHADPKVFSKVLAAYFVPNLMVEGVVLRPRDIMSQVQRLFGAKLKYSTALSARNQALTLTYGDSSKSFQMLPKYLYMLEQSNPGSVVELQTDEDGKFQYCFMSLAACIKGFKACRPVIVVDGTHLKGKYKGIMFVAATKDANEQIFPLAFGLGDVECDESWTWFLRQCRRTFGCPENLLIVSDKHVSIKNAMEAVYPGIPHGLCVYHLQGNIKTWGDKPIVMFRHAASAYRIRDFEERMEHLKSFSPAAYAKLMDIDPSRWARSKCLVRRFKFLTSNCAECLNGRLRWARKMPVCTLLECIRTMIGQWFVERRAEATNRTEELTAYAVDRMARAAELSHSMSTEGISPTKYKVSYGTKHHVVDIQSRTCSCRIYDLDLIPCSHAAAAIRQTKQSAVAYVSEYYTTKTLREIYAGEVMPIPMPEDWCVPNEISSMTVGTPDNPRQAGRPRENRMSAGSGSGSRSHSKGNKICSRCFQRGHYQNTCTVQIELSVEEVYSSQAGNSSKRRRTKRCGICGVSGHTRQSCGQRIIQ